MAVEADHKGRCATFAAPISVPSDEHTITLLPSDSCGPCIDVPLLRRREDWQVLSTPSSIAQFVPPVLALLSDAVWVHTEPSKETSSYSCRASEYSPCASHRRASPLNPHSFSPPEHLTGRRVVGVHATQLQEPLQHIQCPNKVLLCSVEGTLEAAFHRMRVYNASNNESIYGNA